MLHFLFIKQKAAIPVEYHLQILFSGKDRTLQTFASFSGRTLTLLIWLWYLSEKYVMDTVEMIRMCGNRLSFCDPKMHTAVYIRIVPWSVSARSRNWSSVMFPMHATCIFDYANSTRESEQSQETPRQKGFYINFSRFFK